VLGLLDLRERGERLEPSRFESDPTVTETVRGILHRVRNQGDPVLIELAQRFDGADLASLIVEDDEFDRAEADIPADLRGAIDALIERLHDLHTRQLPKEWWDERDGVRFGEVVRPLSAVGCYVPGGRAVYPSSVCMTVVPRSSPACGRSCCARRRSPTARSRQPSCTPRGRRAPRSS
jgi:histidinol dehydrogenase